MSKTSNKQFKEAEIEPLSNHKSFGLHDNAQEDDSGEKYSPSETKRALSQYCATGALSLLTLSFGSSFGFSTILIAELQTLREKDEDFISLSQLTWISSMNYFAIPVGAVFSGLISQLIGRRNSLMLAALPYIVSWLLLYYSGEKQLWTIFMALILIGCTNGIVESPLQIYVTEICEPRLRGPMSASVSATMLFGILLQMLLGSYLDWRSLALANVTFPVLALLTLNFVPESPYWLASKGRYDDARKALAWLRGWTPIRHLPQDEYRDIITLLQKKNDVPRSFKRYFRRSVMLPFALVSFSFCVGCFNGTTSVLTFAMSIFKQLNSDLDEHTCAIILAALMLIATIAMTIMLPYTGKRSLTLLSLAASALSLVVVSGYTYLGQKSTQPSWPPTIAMLSMIFFSFLGIRNIPWIMAGELFPSDVRSQMAGFLGGSYNVYSAIASKTYLYTEQTLTFSGTYLVFAFINFLGLVVLYYVMPETEGKSLIEIEKYYGDDEEDKDNTKPLSKTNP